MPSSAMAGESEAGTHGFGAYAAFKAAIVVLLACNTVWYLWKGSLGQALDSLAWFTLLVLFSYEAGRSEHVRNSVVAQGVRVTRLIAAALIFGAVLAYSQQREWLDLLNSALWIAVVVLLECEVRSPRLFAEARNIFAASAAVLYASLAVLVIVWAARGKWLDAYDAALWLTAFASIELDILRVSRSPRKL
jgi:hypothetical protein